MGGVRNKNPGGLGFFQAIRMSLLRGCLHEPRKPWSMVVIRLVEHVRYLSHSECVKNIGILQFQGIGCQPPVTSPKLTIRCWKLVVKEDDLVSFWVENSDFQWQNWLGSGGEQNSTPGCDWWSFPGPKGMDTNKYENGCWLLGFVRSQGLPQNWQSFSHLRLVRPCLAFMWLIQNFKWKAFPTRYPP